MELIPILITLALIGVIVYCVRLIPMPDPFPTLVLVVGVLFALLYVLKVFGFGLAV